MANEYWVAPYEILCLFTGYELKRFSLKMKQYCKCERLNVMASTLIEAQHREFQRNWLKRSVVNSKGTNDTVCSKEKVKEEAHHQLLDCQKGIKLTLEPFRISGGGCGGGGGAPAATTSNPPGRGGIHPTYGVYLGGGEVEPGWTMSQNCYRFSTQRCDENNAWIVEWGLPDARDKTTTLKFNGNLELDGKEGSENELDKYQFVRTIGQLTREHGHHTFYAIEDTVGIIIGMDWNLHLLTVSDVMASNWCQYNGCKQVRLVQEERNWPALYRVFN
jgi:hypothetical protein